MERSPNYVHTRGGFHQNFYHVEPIRYAGVIQQSQPLFGAADDAVSLGLGHPFMRRSERIGSAGLHFDEYQRFFMAIAADQIDLTAPFGPEILVQ